jgi:hypothetical protein
MRNNAQLTSLQSQPRTSEWHLTETYKSLITLSVEAGKTLALINGGAAVAILAYLGNLVSHTPAPAHVPAIKPALLWYCGGLAAVVLAFLFAYVTQLRLYYEEVSLLNRKPIQRRHMVGVILGLASALVALVAFIMGCFSAANALVP